MTHPEIETPDILPPTPVHRPPVRWDRLLAVFGTGLALVTLLGFLGSLWWVCDLCAHFRPHYLALALAGVLGTALLRNRAWTIILTACVVVNGLTLVPLYLPRPSAPAAGATTLRVMTANLDYQSTRFDAALRLIQAEHPDFVVLQEVDTEWASHLTALAAEYPHSRVAVRDDPFGIALFSRHPFTRSAVIEDTMTALPVVVGDCRIDGQTISILGIHPLPPINAENARLRDACLARIPTFITRNLKGAVIVAGDLNSTPWSAPFRRLLREGGLHDSARGHGPRATWPSGMGPLAIPIDHCLVSDHLTVVGRRVGPDIGSDHLPLIVDVRLAATSAPAR